MAETLEQDEHFHRGMRRGLQDGFATGWRIACEHIASVYEGAGNHKSAAQLRALGAKPPEIDVLRMGDDESPEDFRARVGRLDAAKKKGEGDGA